MQMVNVQCVFLSSLFPMHNHEDNYVVVTMCLDQSSHRSTAVAPCARGKCMQHRCPAVTLQWIHKGSHSRYTLAGFGGPRGGLKLAPVLAICTMASLLVLAPCPMLR